MEHWLVGRGLVGFRVSVPGVAPGHANAFSNNGGVFVFVFIIIIMG